MPCPRCGTQVERTIEEGGGVLSLVCIHGHRCNYYKQKDGTWLNELDHRRNMQVTVKCDECKKDYIIPCATPESYKCCPTCDEKKKKQAFFNLGMIRRNARNKANGKRSPWKMFKFWG